MTTSAPALHPNHAAPALVAEMAAKIKKVAPAAGEGEMVDAMGGSARWEVPVLDHGFVALVDTMPRPGAISWVASALLMDVRRSRQDTSRRRGVYRCHPCHPPD